MSSSGFGNVAAASILIIRTINLLTYTLHSDHALKKGIIID